MRKSPRSKRLHMAKKVILPEVDGSELKITKSAPHGTLILYIDILRQDGHKIVLARGLHAGHPVRLGGHHVLKPVSHIAAVAEIGIPIFIELIKAVPGFFSASGVRT